MRMEIMLLNNGTGSSTKILIDKSSIIEIPLTKIKLVMMIYLIVSV